MISVGGRSSTSPSSAPDKKTCISEERSTIEDEQQKAALVYSKKFSHLKKKLSRAAKLLLVQRNRSLIALLAKKTVARMGGSSSDNDEDGAVDEAAVTSQRRAVEDAINKLLAAQANTVKFFSRKLDALVAKEDAARAAEQSVAIRLLQTQVECGASQQRKKFFDVFLERAVALERAGGEYCDEVGGEARGKKTSGGEKRWAELAKLIKTTRMETERMLGGSATVAAEKIATPVSSFLQVGTRSAIATATTSSTASKRDAFESVRHLLEKMIADLETQNNNDKTHAEFCASQLRLGRQRLRDKKRERKQLAIQIAVGRKSTSKILKSQASELADML